MGKIKVLVSEDTELNENSLDEHGNYPGELEAELEEFMNSLEVRLSSFTSKELLDEYYRRMFEPYNTALKKLSDKIDEVCPF
jgi:hypothetical protein